MYKRGQFYLVAAIVIIAIVFGLGAVYNAVQTSTEGASVVNLKEEIDFESSKVLDSATFSGKSDTEISQIIRETLEFWAESNPNEEIFIIYGNANELYLIKAYFEESQSSVCTGGGNDCTTVVTRERRVDSESVQSDGDSYTFTFKGVTREVTLNDEENNFYLVVKKETDEGDFVSTTPGGETDETPPEDNVDDAPPEGEEESPPEDDTPPEDGNPPPIGPA